MKKLPLVSVIIPAYRSEVFMEGLIKSIEQTDYPNFEVIVVFDPSSDKGPQIAKEIVGKNKRWKIIENKTRLGSTKSLNLGIRQSKGELVAFIPCDMVVDPKWMRELVEFLTHAELSVGAAIAKIYDFHQRNRLQVHWMYLMPQTGWVVIPEFGCKDGPRYQKPIETYSGAEAIIVRRHVFGITGMYDEDIDALIYDLDMTWRIWLGGFRIVRIPTAKVYHWSLKVGRQNAKWEFLYCKMINFFIQNYSLKSLMVYLPQMVVIYSTRAILLLASGNSDALRGWLTALFWTIRNLPKTLKKRQVIQTQVRRVSDEYLFEKIFFKGNLWSFYRYWKRTKERISPLLLTEEGKKEGVVSYSA